jgi:hypothetical protein
MRILKYLKYKLLRKMVPILVITSFLFILIPATTNATSLSNKSNSSGSLLKNNTVNTVQIFIPMEKMKNKLHLLSNQTDHCTGLQSLNSK